MRTLICGCVPGDYLKLLYAIMNLDNGDITMPTCPICGSEILDESVRKKCGQCGNADRTRTLFLMYQTLRRFLATLDALVFTEENWLPAEYFKSCEKSIYLGQNHLDIQNIARNEGSYSWVASNHVVEHVENDASALREMFRLLTAEGILQLTVPTPSRIFETRDWGFADETKMGHFRNYGADFSFKLQQELPKSWILSVFMSDNLSLYTDICYLVTKCEKAMGDVGSRLIQGGYVVVPLARPMS